MLTLAYKPTLLSSYRHTWLQIKTLRQMQSPESQRVESQRVESQRVESQQVFPPYLQTYHSFNIQSHQYIKQSVVLGAAFVGLIHCDS